MELAQKKKAKSLGLTSREEYWGSVQNSLSETAQLSPLLVESGSHIRVTGEHVVLVYPLTPEVNLDLIVDERDMRSIGVAIISEGRYEPLLERALLLIARHCKVFTDIGANAGFYSLAVQALVPECKVTAFECNPEVRKVFERNVELNGLKNILIRHEALSDQTGEAEFHVPALTGSGGGSLRDLHPEEGESQKFSVKLLPLDSLTLEKIDFMKIDVEGAELAVVKGALRSIRESLPTIFIELLRKWMKPFDSSPQDVSELLLGLGYLSFEVTEEQVEEVVGVSEHTLATNFVFVHKSRTDHLEIIRGVSAKF